MHLKCMHYHFIEDLFCKPKCISLCSNMLARDGGGGRGHGIGEMKVDVTSTAA